MARMNSQRFHGQIWLNGHLKSPCQLLLHHLHPAAVWLRAGESTDHNGSCTCTQYSLCWLRKDRVSAAALARVTHLSWGSILVDEAQQPVCEHQPGKVGK